MFEIMSPKGKGYAFTGKWYKISDKMQQSYFKFSIASDMNRQHTDYNNLTGTEGLMTIKTKSLIDFSPKDIIIFTGVGNDQKFTVVSISKNLTQNSTAYSVFKNNGNIEKTIVLRLAG